MEPWAGKSLAVTKRTASEIVHDILRTAGKPATWKQLKSIAKREYPHLSTATLWRHLNIFIKNELATKYVSDEKRRYPIAYYALPHHRRPILPPKMPPWTDKQANKAFETMYLAMSLFMFELGGQIEVACEKGVLKEAEAYIDLVVATRLKELLRSLVSLCYRYRDLTVDEIKTIHYAVWQFTPEAEAGKWLEKYAPAWAKPHIGHMPDEHLAQIAVFNRKDRALREIHDFYEAERAAIRSYESRRTRQVSRDHRGTDQQSDDNRIA